MNPPLQAIFDAIPLVFGNAQVHGRKRFDHLARFRVELRAAGTDQQLALKLRHRGEFLTIDDVLRNTFSKFFTVVHKTIHFSK
jgi:hypothetical protein